MFNKIFTFIIGFLVICLGLYYMGWLGTATTRVEETFRNNNIPQSNTKTNFFWQDDLKETGANTTNNNNAKISTANKTLNYTASKITTLLNNIIDYSLLFVAGGILLLLAKRTPLDTAIRKIQEGYNNYKPLKKHPRI